MQCRSATRIRSSQVQRSSPHLVIMSDWEEEEEAGEGRLEVGGELADMALESSV